MDIFCVGRCGVCVVVTTDYRVWNIGGGRPYIVVVAKRKEETQVMKIHNRDYQAEGLTELRTAFESHPSALLVLATGLGKTIMFAQLANEYIDKGRVMILAHREELIFQAKEKVGAVVGTVPDVEMGQFHSDNLFGIPSPVVVSTIQTQIAGHGGAGRMTKFSPDEFSLLVIDEAHHSAAASYRRVINYYRQNPEIKVLGVTATPDRADELALGQIFDTVAFEFGIREGISEGWLVPIKQRYVAVDGLDYSQVKTTAGDLNGKDLAEVLEYEDILHQFASPIIELCGERRTLIFAASVAHAERLCEILNRHKMGCAECVSAGTPKDDRRAILRDYNYGELQYLVNVGVATEGFDSPGIEVICMARPTKSRALYAQMCGRATRVLPDVVDGVADAETRRMLIEQSAKPSMEVLDFVGNSGRHKLITTADLLGGIYVDEQEIIGDKTFESVVERAQIDALRGGEPVDMMEALERAEQALEQEKQHQADMAKRKRVTARAKFSTAAINPFDVLDIEPNRIKGWNKDRRPSTKQLELLKRWGADTAGLNFQHASQLIGKMIKRREKGLATFKQCRLLRKFSYEVEGITFDQASEMITGLKDNGWRRLA